jgi:hypothetical protein
MSPTATLILEWCKLLLANAGSPSDLNNIIKNARFEWEQWPESQKQDAAEMMAEFSDLAMALLNDAGKTIGENMKP